MKIRNSSRITAIVLALMMIVPLISVPAFATDTEVDAGTEPQAILKEDFESYEEDAPAVGNGLVTGPSNAVIATLDGNKCVKYDLNPMTTSKEGALFINVGKGVDAFHVATLLAQGGASFDPTTQTIVYNGTVSISGTTFYFKGATLNTNYMDVACKLYTDEACTKEYKDDSGKQYYFCSAAVRNSVKGGGGSNICQPCWIGGAGATSTVFVASADYYFASNVKAGRCIDIRLDDQNGKNREIASIDFVEGGVKVRLHTDMEVKMYNPGYIVERDTWFTLTAVVESHDGKYSTTVYVDGNLAAYGESSKNGGSFTGTKNGFNLGHTARNATVDAFFGNYYVDNVSLYATKDVVPSDWEVHDTNKLLNENFDVSTAFPSGTVNWSGTGTKTIVTENGNNYLTVDANSNKDKRLELLTAAKGGIIRVDVDYYIPSTAVYGFQGQFVDVVADRSKAWRGEPSLNGSVTGEKTSWVDLYFISVADGKAWIRDVGDYRSTTGKMIVNSELPTDKFFTLSTIIDLDTGKTVFLVDGELAAALYLWRTDGYLTNISFDSAKLLVGKINTVNTAKVSVNNDGKTFRGYLGMDNIKVTKIDAMPTLKTPSADHDFEDATVGNSAVNPDTTLPMATGAKYGELFGNKHVEISMLGAAEASTLDNPFIVLNYRSYDIINKVASFEAPETLTLDFLQNNMTLTKATDNSKPIYYAYVESEKTVYVYNNGGNEATDANIDGFTLTTHTIGEPNYNSMFRTICGGTDTNIDKAFRVKHPGFAVAGTYVLSADYFIANDASGIVLSQSYNPISKKWLEFYQFDLNTNKFYTRAGGIVAGKDGQSLLVDQWNNVTMIINVQDNLNFSADFYLNGVYTFTKNFGYAFASNSWSLAKVDKPNSPENAALQAGYIRIDNVKVNAVAYDENDIQTVDASKVLGFDIEYKDGTFQSLVNVSNSTELKIYGAANINAMTTDFLDMRVGNIVTTTDKASIRLYNETGLRFATEINAATLAFLDQMIANGQIKGYNYGTLIAPTVYITEGKTLSFEDFTEDVDMLDVEATTGKFYDVDGDASTTHFAGSIKNIFKSNYNRAFSGRGYFQVTLMNGEVVTYYSGYTHSVSVAQQAKDTIGLYEEGTDEYKILADFAAALQ